MTWDIRRYRFAGVGPVMPNCDLKNTNWSGEKFGGVVNIVIN